MRILISGLLVFLIWASFSSYIYVEKIWQEPVDLDLTIAEENVIEESSDTLMTEIPDLPSEFTVYFDYNKSDFMADNQNDAKFEAFLDYLIFATESTVEITGYTDGLGSAEYNHRLGLTRANSVILHFHKLGINDDRLIIKSEGESNPVASNNTVEGRAKNRRAEITIKK
ncbi:MAG: OmpA family protein [Bacteroidales bacterium]|nr:OmpA family protein [Bacteroidales bacterium]